VTHGTFGVDHAFINLWFKVAGFSAGEEITLVPTATSCYGPYRVEMVNSSGATALGAVILSSALIKEYDIRINFDNTTTTKLFARGANGATAACGSKSMQCWSLKFEFAKSESRNQALGSLIVKVSKLPIESK
jgi:hypothetical protein